MKKQIVFEINSDFIKTQNLTKFTKRFEISDKIKHRINYKIKTSIIFFKIKSETKQLKLHKNIK